MVAHDGQRQAFNQRERERPTSLRRRASETRQLDLRHEPLVLCTYAVTWERLRLAHEKDVQGRAMFAPRGDGDRGVWVVGSQG